MANRGGVAMWVMMLACIQSSMAVVYRVGDAAGWTIIGSVDYKKWSATKSFRLGDTILFEYNPQYHNVMQVTHADFRACNTSSPISTYTTGKDAVTIKTPGHHFFLCGIPGHCQIGQKVDINVIRPTSTSVAPSPSFSPSIPPPDVSASSPASSSSPSKASSVPISLNTQFGIVLVLALVTPAYFVSGFA